ncbi:MAG: VOC family protein [Thermoanaerobaculia bacterium]
MSSVNLYLNFDGNTEEAFDFYRGVFGQEYQLLVRFRDFPAHAACVDEAQLDKIAHVALPLGNGTVLMGTDVVDRARNAFVVGTNVYIHLDTDSEGEANRLFAALSDGGSVQMPLARTEWAEAYGVCADRFGVQWMVNHTGRVRFALDAAAPAAATN